METIFLIIIVIVGLAAILKLIEYIILGISTNHDKKAHGKGLVLDVPITYQTTWWAYQDGLMINDLAVEVVQSELNLMNSESVVSYTIQGEIYFENNEVSIQQIHISERVNRGEDQSYDRIFELTPVVQCKPKSGVAGKFAFEIKNQHRVHSTRWGANRVLFVCGDMQQVIELQQLK